MSRRPLRDVTQFGPTIPGFSIWYDRWNGHGWCWRELPDSPFRTTGNDAVTEGRGLRSKMAARGAIREEIMRRRSESATAQQSR